MTEYRADPLGIETYGYPQIDVTAPTWVRISEGWFLPGLHDDEPACYLDLYIDRYGKAFIMLDYWKNIQFHFEISILIEDALHGLRWLLGDAKVE